MTKQIELLNRRLREELGTVGGQARFAWQYAPEVHYFTRRPTALTFTRHCWAERIGKVWMLCQWRLPTSFDPETGATKLITEAAWWSAYQGQLPYPSKGMYWAQPETAREPGRQPTMEETVGYIWSIRQQIEKDFQSHLREGKAEMDKDRLDSDKEFMDEAADWFPAGWKNGQGHEPGTRGAHISFPTVTPQQTSTL
jgi:hypothetical protein